MHETTSMKQPLKRKKLYDGQVQVTLDLHQELLTAFIKHFLTALLCQTDNVAG